MSAPTSVSKYNLSFHQKEGIMTFTIRAISQGNLPGLKETKSIRATNAEPCIITLALVKAVIMRKEFKDCSAPPRSIITELTQQVYIME